MDIDASGMMDPTVLQELLTMKMPYGRYKGIVLCNLPEPYVVWHYEKGFPKGRLGMLLSTLYEIKLYGLEDLLKPLRKK